MSPSFDRDTALGPARSSHILLKRKSSALQILSAVLGFVQLNCQVASRHTLRTGLESAELDVHEYPRVFERLGSF